MIVDKAKFIQRWGEDPGWRAFIGFIAVPNLSGSFLEFLKIAPEGVIATCHHTYTTKNGVPTKFDFTVEGINEALGQVEEAAVEVERFKTFRRLQKQEAHILALRE